MSVVARAEIEIEHPLDAVFDELVDFARWERWMPKAFRPVEGPQRRLSVGDQVHVRIAGALATRLTVTRVEANRALAWRGGVPSVLLGEHAFYFDDLGGGRTRVRSEEPFSGLLVAVPVLNRVVERAGSRAGLEILEALKTSLKPAS